MADADHSFEQYRQHGSPDALARVYDATAVGLLRVAMHLAPDAASAEDLVQQTFLTAIEKAASFEPGRPVRPWLTGILHHHAANARRRERRRAPPGRPIEPTGDDDPVQALAGAEFDRALDDAIDRLPDAYRPVLVLRLRHGMSPAEIAHALRRPPGTVRTQLVRGVARLRALVPAALGAALATWALPTRGLAAVRATVLARAADTATVVSATAGGTAVLVTSILAMKKALFVVLVAAALAIVYGLWPGAAGSPPEPPPGTPPVADTGSAGLPETAASGVRSPAPAAADSTAPVARAPWRLVGSVPTRAGVPIDGARLRVVRGAPEDRPFDMTRLFDLAASRTPDAAPLQMSTDTQELANVAVAADGSFAVADLREAHVRLELEHRFYGLSTVIPVHAPADAALVDVGELAAYCGGHVLGALLGSGAPAGTEVELTSEPDPMAVLRDPEAFFSLSLRGGGATAALDTAARFEFRAVPAAAAVSLRIRHGDLLAEAPPLPLGAGETREVLMVPRPTGGLEVRCSTETGEPLAGVDVRVTPDNVSGQFRVLRSASEARTGDDGVARFHGLQPVGHRIVAECTGRDPVRQAIAIGAGAIASVEVTLRVGPTIHGRVVDAAGAPIADAGVRLVPSMDVPLFGDVIASTAGQALGVAADKSPVRTAADGSFTLGGAGGAERWNVVAAAAGYGFGIASGAIPGGAPVEIALERPSTLRGTVRTADGAAVDRFDARTAVTMFLAFERPTAVAAGRAGSFTLTDVPPGRATLQIDARELGRATREVELAPGQDLDVGEIVLATPAAVRGSVVAADGSPVAKAQVRVGRGGMFDHPVMAMFRREQSAITDASGRFELRPVDPGVVRLIAEADGHARGESERLDLAAGAVAESVELRLGTGGTVVGTLLLPPGSDPADWQVVCNQEVQMTTALTQVEPDGSFRFDHIEPGRHQIQAMDTRAMERMSSDLVRDLSPGAIPDVGGLIRQMQDMTVQERVEVIDGEVTEVELDASWLTREGAALEIDVTLGDEPLATALVEVAQPEASGAERLRLTTVERGRIEVHGLEPGLVRLTIRGGLTMMPLGEPLEFELPTDAEVVRRTWRLPGGRIAGRVVDAATDAPIAGATLRLVPLDAARSGRDRDPGFALADADGRFAFEGLAPGRYDLLADQSLTPVDGDHTGRIDGIAVGDGQRVDGVVLRAARGAGLELQVTGPDGRPLGRCRVLAIAANGTPLGGFPGTWTDAEGRAWFAGLPADTAVRAVAWPDGLAPAFSSPVTVSAVDPVRLALRCDAGTEVDLELVDADGRPLANAAVGMRIGDGPWLSLPVLGRHVDAAGRLALGALPSTEVTFAVRHPRATFEATRRIGGGRKVTLALAP